MEILNQGFGLQIKRIDPEKTNGKETSKGTGKQG
jgi:hypothetical protein